MYHINYTFSFEATMDITSVSFPAQTIDIMAVFLLKLFLFILIKAEKYMWNFFNLSIDFVSWKNKTNPTAFKLFDPIYKNSVLGQNLSYHC